MLWTPTPQLCLHMQVDGYLTLWLYIITSGAAEVARQPLANTPLAVILASRQAKITRASINHLNEQ